MFDVLNATTRTDQELAESGLAFDERPAPQIIPVPHQQIESAGYRLLISGAAMQGIKLRHALVIETDHLGIKDGSALDARRFLDDARIAIGPIGPVHRIEPHQPVADIDLQPITIMLQFMRPARAIRRLLGDNWTTWVDEGSRYALS